MHAGVVVCGVVVVGELDVVESLVVIGVVLLDFVVEVKEEGDGDEEETEAVDATECGPPQTPQYKGQ